MRDTERVEERREGRKGRKHGECLNEQRKEQRGGERRQFGFSQVEKQRKAGSAALWM